MLPMGGSERVTLATINVLSSLGWKVDLYSVDEFRPSDLSPGFGVDVKVNCRVRTTRIPSPIRKLGDFRGGGLLYPNLLRRYLEKRIEECDVFIDMMPYVTLGAIYTRMPDMVYWNLPPNLASFSAKYGTLNEAYLLPIRCLLPSLSRRWESVKMHVANSRFTRHVVKGLSSGLTPAVIYPPVDIELWSVSPSEGPRSGITSLARFDKWKRQDLQLTIMKGMRTQLKMIGRAIRKEEIAYLRDLEQMAKKAGHVDFYVNLPQPQVKTLLSSSKVFIHTAEDEPFGITIVEAIAAGCVPIVREGGSATEIVPFEEFRFRTIEQARDKIRRAFAGEYDHLLPKLTAHIQQFHERRFRREFMEKALQLST